MSWLLVSTFTFLFFAGGAILDWLRVRLSRRAATRARRTGSARSCDFQVSVRKSIVSPDSILILPAYVCSAVTICNKKTSLCPQTLSPRSGICGGHRHWHRLFHTDTASYQSHY